MITLLAKNKKWLVFLTAIALVVSFAGCGSSEPSKNEAANNNGAANSTTITEVPTEPQPKITFEGLTAIDNDECTIKITGIESSNIRGYTLKVLLENKSTVKTYRFSLQGASVNGIDCKPLFATKVAPGKKANDEITFYNDILDGIDFTDIELIFRVYDDNDWMADPVALETTNVYPYGQENASLYVREAKDTDTILVDNEFVTAIITDYEMDNIRGYCANIYLVNKTDSELMFAVDEASVNGFMVDPFWANSVLPGKCAFSSISWRQTDLEENGITDVEELEFILRAYDNHNLLDDDIVNQVFTLTP